MRRFIPLLSAATVLAIFVLLLFYRLLFTDRVLASGDILHYFYPYRDFAAASLRAGDIPLWNPYIFMGAPFLANPQAASLYPLHWPLSWLPVTRQIYWSGSIHAWILALGGYALMRRWGVGWLAAVSTGLVLAGSGFFGGLLGHINQMNGAAWLPWLLWALEGRWSCEEEAESSEERGETSRSSLYASHAWKYAALVLPFSLFAALTLLAGHTQTTYINLFGVGAWLLATSLRAYSYGFRLLAGSFFIYVLGVLLGVLLAAAQLFPTLELSQLGLRGGGLSYVDVTSFSLRPLLLHWTLLPSYGLRDLSVVFATLGYTEFVAHIGVLGLLLALIAVVSSQWAAVGNRPWNIAHWPPATLCGLFFAGLGLFLALGRWNPFSFLFYHLIPGFDLFRTPARWMMLYTLGMAVLAGGGAEWVRGRLTAISGEKPVRRLLLRAAGVVLLALLALDLLAAARALPHTQPTAPQAVYDVRSASAHLLTEPRRALHPGVAGRLLSISEITFDPGDMPDWRRILRGGARPQLNEAAFTEFIIALKSQEILAPNLSLLWRIPTVDGFDGGVLPLQRYNAFLSLLIPPAELVPDGRVREQLHTVPPAQILDMMDVRFVITDKVRDVWFDDIYFDRQIGASLVANGLNSPADGTDGAGIGGGPRLTVDAPYSFEATAVAVVGFVTSDAGYAGTPDLPLADVIALINGERRTVGRLLTGSQAGAFRVASSASLAATGTDAPVAFHDGESGQEEYLAVFALAEAVRLDALEISLAVESASAGLAVQAVTLIDERTKTFVPLLPSDRGRFQRVHSGDVKIYERLGGSGRAQLVEAVEPASSMDEAVALLHAISAQGNSQASAVVEAGMETIAGWGLADQAGTPAGDREASIVSYTPERVVIRARSELPSFLMLKDAYYPGWQAAVNGEPVEIVATNVLFRGVPVPAGESEVVFWYGPQSWQTGLSLSLAGSLLWLLLALWTARCASTRKR
ncbi:MAG: YfhO family protein [Caldilineaceae bacterium]|nr:YfhO family protein [Caldilineaceae bacterium]